MTKLTDYHPQLYAHELARRHAPGDIRGITATLMGAKADLNPHQVDAALFAFRSPLSQGAILADEVGLKNIGAAIATTETRPQNITDQSAGRYPTPHRMERNTYNL